MSLEMRYCVAYKNAQHSLAFASNNFGRSIVLSILKIYLENPKSFNYTSIIVKSSFSSNHHLDIKDNYPKIVVSMDEMIGKQYEGISHINIREFLSEYR